MKLQKPRNANHRGALRPDFRQLETFLKVAETRSFAEAARQLGVSQPAVSQTIARLEDLYGGDLFERRRGAPVALSPIGNAILPKVKLLLFTVDQQIERALATARSMSGSLTIGFYPGLAFGPLNAGIGDFHQSSPDVQLRLVEAPPGELYRQLNERTIDIIFVAFQPNIAGGANAQERMWDEPLVAAVRSDDSLVAKKQVHWTDICSRSIILRSQQGDLTSYRALVARIGDCSVNCELHDVSRGALIEMVKLGFGTAISFASAAVPREGVQYLPIADQSARVSVDAVWPKDDRNPLRHRLLTCVRKRASV